MMYAAASAVLAVALLACRVLRNESASTRHLVLAAAFAVTVLAPFTARVLPKSEPVRRLQEGIVVQVSAGDGRILPRPTQRNGDEPLTPSLANAVVAASVGGISFTLIRLLTTLVSRRAASWPAPPPVAAAAAEMAVGLGIRRRLRVRVSRRISVPETSGLIRPLVLLPSGYLNGTTEQLQTALLHELHHIRRCDWAVGILAEFAAAFHWFNPLAGVAVRQLRLEREIACDDAVLRSGADPLQYAEQLISCALAGRPSPAPALLTMARMSGLELRIRSILNNNTQRGGTTMRTRIKISAAAVLLLAGAAAVQTPAQAPASLSGTVVDEAAKPMSGASILARKIRTEETAIVLTDSRGEFSFSALTPGDYRVEVARAGFQLFREPELTLSAGSARRLRVTLTAGRLIEPAQPGAPVPDGSGGEATRTVHVERTKQSAKIVSLVRPAYPESAKKAGISGVVLMDAVIGRDGSVVSLRPAGSDMNPSLVQAAMEAVSKWRYEPTYLNGEPVAVSTAVTVNYTLMP